MRVIHAPAQANPSLPLCGRVLSRNASLTARGHFTMLTGASTPAPGFAPGQTTQPEHPCRHCQRALGLLPRLQGRARGWAEDEDNRLADSDDFEETDAEE